MKKIYITGSFTVEAAIITSIVLFTILGIISLSFFMHDYSVEKSKAYHKATSSLEPPVKYIWAYQATRNLKSENNQTSERNHYED